MSLELIYTSAPRGLMSSAPGFCTVAATAGMPRQVLMKLEALSGYEFHFNLSDPNARLNPVNFAHTPLTIGTESFGVLSRIGFSGADYSQRTNKIAHHFALTPAEFLPIPHGPAWMLRQLADGLFKADWREDARELPPRGENVAQLLRERMGGNVPAGPARHWQEATGDAGWAGALVKALREKRDVPAFVLFKPGMDVLPLFEECLALLPPAERWAVGFATYYSTLPAGCYYHWRGVLAGSSAMREIARFPGATVIDLTRPLGRAEANPYTEAARTGQVLFTQTPAVGAVREPPLRAAGQKASWDSLLSDTFKLHGSSESDVAELEPDTSDEELGGAPDAGQWRCRLAAAEQGNRRMRLLAIALAVAAGVFLVLALIAFLQWSGADTRLQSAKLDYEGKLKAVEQARKAAEAETKKTQAAVHPVLPPLEHKDRPPKPSTQDPSEVVPKKKEPPKKDTEPAKKEPELAKDGPKTPPPVPLKLEQLTAGSVAGDPQDPRPKSDESGQVRFEFGPFDAVLAPPISIKDYLSFEAFKDDTFEVKHKPSKGGLTKPILLLCKRQDGAMIWELKKEAEEDYGACLKNLAIIAADRRDKNPVLHRCMRQRQVLRQELTLVYREDGSFAGKPEDRTAAFSYPWVEGLQVQHGGLESGRAWPLVSSQVPKAGEGIEAKRTSDARRDAEICFKRKPQKPGGSASESRAVLRFTVSAERDQTKGTEVRITLDAPMITEVLKGSWDQLTALRRQQELWVIRGQRLTKAEADLKEAKAERPTLEKLLPEWTARLGQLRGDRNPDPEKKRENEINRLNDHVGKGNEKLEWCKKMMKENPKEIKELQKTMRGRKAEEWVAQVGNEIKPLEDAIALPELQLKELGDVKVLDPWGLELVVLKAVVRREPPKPPGK